LFDRIKKILEKIKNLNGTVDTYRQESIIQSLPTVAYVNKAKKFIEQRDYNAAEDVLKKALDISTQDARVYKYLGKINEARHKFQVAADFYDPSARLNPQDKEIWLRLGMCYLNCGRYDDAIDSFERAKKVTPVNTDVCTGWGMALMKQKKYALARDKFIEASAINKYNFTAILLSAIMEIRLCDYDSAEVKLKFLAKVAPNEGSTYEYANLKLLKSDYKEAEIYAQKALEINKQMLPAYFVLGEVYSIQKDLQKTMDTFNRAIELELDGAALRFEFGKAYVRFFDFQNAREQFNKALEFEHDYLNAKIGIALMDAYTGDFELLDGLKERNGEIVYIQEAIGLEWAAHERYEDAIDMFKKALRIDSKQTYNYLNIARAYQKLNNKDKTKEYFERFTSENPWYVKGFLEYSKWLIDNNEIAEARRKLNKAQKLDGADIEILNLLFFTSYTLVKENICEYNIKEAIALANKIQAAGELKYPEQKSELENILNNIQGK